MVVAESGRLIIRHFTLADAPFIVALLNDPAFIANIGDRGIRTLAEAEAYLQNGAIASYAQHGFGLNLVVQKSSGESIGMCGLIRRATLPAVDIGYAFLPAYTGRGYAREAARLIMQTARQRHGLDRLLAIVNPDNERSIRLLQKLGFDYAGPIRLQPDAEPISLFEASLREQSTTAELLVQRALNHSVTEAWVNWAAAMLADGHDTPHLRQLAATVAPYEDNQFALWEMVDRCLAELGLEWHDREKVLHDYGAELLQKMLAGQRLQAETMRLMQLLYEDSSGHEDFVYFSQLHWALYDLQRGKVTYEWPGATRENIDDIIRQTALDWLAQFGPKDNS
ncbi:MAG: GNAT family N-acetyltransferase [Ardenticatenales bacterium]|nr:GNAT family N-acetyltransferase [Ardenticatenales bacterium]